MNISQFNLSYNDSKISHYNAYRTTTTLNINNEWNFFTLVNQIPKINWQELKLPNSDAPPPPPSGYLFYEYKNSYITIGKNSNSGDFSIDNLKIYSSTLTNDEINTMRNETFNCGIDSSSPPIPEDKDCNSEVMKNVAYSGKWHLLSTNGMSGCTKTKLKTLGAKSVYTFDSAINNWRTDDSIEVKDGFWIKK